MSTKFISDKCEQDREVLAKMNDQEFNKKLESILGNLYKIDREVKECLKREMPRLGNQEYSGELSRRYEQREYKEYKT